jgi:GNAT superfamily N-acetyltransferase
MNVSFTERNSESLEAINQFYKLAGYGSQAKEEDRIFLCKLDQKNIIGAVRFCLEENHLILRGMYFLNEYRGKGLGKELLNSTIPFLTGAKMDCFAVPYEHLLNFYSLIGFQELEEKDAPRFLNERLDSYKNRGLKVTLIKRKGTLE